MKSWQPVIRWTGLAAAAVALAACSTDGEASTEQGSKPSAASSSVAPTTPSVDVAALDTGKYPTTPRAPFGETTHDNLIQVEGQRMAQYIVVPFEIDAELTKPTNPTMVIIGRDSMRPLLPKESWDVRANAALVGGFVSTASTPDEMIRSGKNRALNNMVVRYLTPADAKAAAQQMAEGMAAKNNTTTTSLPGSPESLVIRTSLQDQKMISVFTPHGRYVLFQWYQVRDGQEDKLVPTVSKAIKLQSALIDQFPATPTKAEKAAGDPGRVKVVMDENRVLIYALPFPDEQVREGANGIPGANVRAVYGPRGMAHVSSDPSGTFKLLNQVGSTANGIERSTVYRAKDDAGATTLINSMTSSAKGSGWKDIAPPPGLPVAHCQSTAAPKTNYACYVQLGRYVGEVHSTDKTDAYQQISAQYVIFTKADQNAK
ncbi:hypothetical protein AAFP35_04000 [Gordonia sp. CPCC 206044]|uniref:DUF7373 family lipoprotein n=1 Tax=Gordonia sp. CPCC 206044 TaxID=3140793 RepID=UPI003AF3AD13